MAARGLDQARHEAFGERMTGATRRFVLGAVLVYQLTLLLRPEQGADVRTGLEAFLAAA
jgi:hypothetical protein